MKTLLCFVAALAASIVAQPAAQAEVTWRVSVKLILGPSGERPGAPAITDAEIEAEFDFANTNLYFIGRGIRLEKSEVVEITPPTSASRDWFAVDLLEGNNKYDLEAEAMADAAYAWSTDKINIYLNDGTATGSSSFPSSGHSIIVIGADKTQNTPWVFIHEIGHFMSLLHTHAGQSCGDGEELDCADCPDPTPGDDDISDTIPDHGCFDQNDLARAKFENPYSALAASQQEEVDNTFFNIMSYHDDRSVFTTLQLDAMCDTSNRERDIVSHNNFIFVDMFAAGIAPDGSSKLAVFGGPFQSLPDAIDLAGGGDVILMRPGSYVEDRVVRKAITLRAVRRDMLTSGNAIIR